MSFFFLGGGPVVITLSEQVAPSSQGLSGGDAM
jgi:hypothetical protein